MQSDVLRRSCRRAVCNHGGVGWTLLLDAGSFAIAALMTAAIAGPARGAADRISADAAERQASSFVTELRSGFAAVHRVPLLLWLSIAIAFFNLLLSPMQVLLPTYAKVNKGMPAWFLGGLESSLGVGNIIGLGDRWPGKNTPPPIERRRRPSAAGRRDRIPFARAGRPRSNGHDVPHRTGRGVDEYPHRHESLGGGSRSLSLARELHFRVHLRRLGADRSRGRRRARRAVGVSNTMTWMGILMLVAVPALFRMPGFREFFRASPSQLTNHFLKAYPHVFGRRTG